MATERAPGEMAGGWWGDNMRKVKIWPWYIISELQKQNKLIDEALMRIAALPTVGGAMARESIKKIREELGLCEPS